jgi:hypothetical protein
MSGCFWYDEPPPVDNDIPIDESAERDRRAYVELQRALDESRHEALGEQADELRAAGDVLFWLEFAGFDPTLHSHGADATVDYGFGIGSGNDYNFRASEKAVATAEPNGEVVTYRLHARSAPNTLLGEQSWPSPTDEQKWWAYAVDGETLYVVTTGDHTELHRYAPGGAPEVVADLDAAGCEIGIFWDFGVDGDDMMFVESGRLWRFDIGSGQCTFMGNETEIAGTVDFRSDGALYEAYDGPFFYDAAAGRTVDLAAEIASSNFRLNPSFDSAHRWSYDVARWGRWFVYVGGSGVFAYHLDDGRVVPVLLEPIDEEVRISYRYPVVLESGMLYVTGLTSYSGSTGADGPVYRVDLNAVLR